MERRILAAAGIAESLQLVVFVHSVLDCVLKMNGASARCRSALILYLALSFLFRLTNEQLRFVQSVHVCAFCFT